MANAARVLIPRLRPPIPLGANTTTGTDVCGVRTGVARRLARTRGAALDRAETGEAFALVDAVEGVDAGELAEAVTAGEAIATDASDRDAQPPTPTTANNATLAAAIRANGGCG